MKHAIELLEKELKFLETPLSEDEDEDLIDAVIGMRKTKDVKLALKVLNDFLDSSKILNL